MIETSTELPAYLQRMVEAGVPGIDIMHGHLKVLMLEAEVHLEDAQQVEDYSGDAMDSMERKYWEGVVETLVDMYKLTYDISFALGARE